MGTQKVRGSLSALMMLYPHTSGGEKKEEGGFCLPDLKNSCILSTSGITQVNMVEAGFLLG